MILIYHHHCKFSQYSTMLFINYLNSFMLLYVGSDEMQIFVLKTWDGDFISLEVKTSDTIRDVKVKILDKLEIPVDDQILLYEEQPLQNSNTLLHYSIPENATLHLRLRLRG